MRFENNNNNNNYINNKVLKMNMSCLGACSLVCPIISKIQQSLSCYVALEITKKNDESNNDLYSIHKFRCFKTTHLQLTFELK